MPELGELLTIRDVAKLAERSRRASSEPLSTPWVCEASLKPGVRGCRCATCENGYRRMKNQLLTSNGQCGGMLMVNVTRSVVHPTWRLTREALAQMHPQWFVRSQKVEDRVVDLERKLAEQTELVEIAHKHIGELRREIEALKKRRLAA